MQIYILKFPKIIYFAFFYLKEKRKMHYKIYTFDFSYYGCNLNVTSLKQKQKVENTFVIFKDIKRNEQNYI